MTFADGKSMTHAFTDDEKFEKSQLEQIYASSNAQSRFAISAPQRSNDNKLILIRNIFLPWSWSIHFSQSCGQYIRNPLHINPCVILS